MERYYTILSFFLQYFFSCRRAQLRQSGHVFCFDPREGAACVFSVMTHAACTLHTLTSGYIRKLLVTQCSTRINGV